VLFKRTALGKATCKPSIATMKIIPSLLLNLAMPITSGQAIVIEEEIVDQLHRHELSTSNASQSSLSTSLHTVVDSSNQSQDYSLASNHVQYSNINSREILQKVFVCSSGYRAWTSI